MKRFGFILLLALTAACEQKAPPLTAAGAEQLVRNRMFMREPVYAEVPQKVWFGPKAPKDDFDDKSIATLTKLQRAGYVTVAHSRQPDGGEVYQARVTEKGFRILGTMPSARGPVYRAKICERTFDKVQNFIRHPNDPTVGRAEIVWHYDNPTPMYDYFDTKMNKPLNTPFIALASFYWDKGQYHVETTIKKTDAE